jgi:flagellar hook-associated protein 1 FlgK
MGFASLNTAVSGLRAAQRGMETVGQNIVNANTPGYSRQRVELSSTGVTTAATFHTGTDASFGGVTVDGVTRIRDAFLESTRVAAGARMSALQSQASALSGAEQLLAEPSDTGLSSALDAFYASWHDLSVRPQDQAAGAVVLQQGASVASQLRFVSQGVGQQWGTAREGLQNVVNQANQAASDLARINDTIRSAVVADRPVNELLDQRDQLVRTITNLVGGAAVSGDDGMVTVSVNGVALVSGTQAQPFTLSGATDIAGAAGSPPTISWGNTAVPVDSGQAAGLLAALRTDLPQVSAQLDGVATSLRDAVNTLHSAGFTLAGSAGGSFFAGTGAGDLTVVPAAVSDLAVASASGVVDGATALALGDLADDTNARAVLAGAGGGEGPSVRWRDLSAALGVKVQGLDRAVATQDAVLAAADSAVQADSGVNLDEEMTNMLLWQRAYQASARVITTADEMLDTLVNRTGLVGR